MASERKFVTENIRRVLLKEYMMARVGRAGFGGLDVQRTPMGTRVTLITERPGLVIGRRGEAIKSLTKAIEEDFKFNNPQIEVQEVENPNLNAQIMAEKLANALEKGWTLNRPEDHGVWCERLPGRHRRKAHGGEAQDREVQGRPHKVLWPGQT